MSLIEKFSAVEIKADNRISEDDKAFCLRQQEAFDKAGPGRVFSQREIYELVDPDSFDSSWTGISSIIYELRHKLNADFIQIVYG